MAGKLIQAIRPNGYTGQIKDCPDQKEVKFETIEEVYKAWSEKYFESNPRKKLTHNGFNNNPRQVTIYGKSNWVTSFWFED